MRQSSLLISNYIFESFPFLKDLSGTDIRDLLHDLLKDPELPAKINLLVSNQYTKIYQPTGLDLKMVKFYPFAEDWSHLSVLSNGSGFSRCYIFVFLLLFYLGELKLEEFTTNGNTGVITSKIGKVRINDTHYCHILVNKEQKYLQRKQKHPGHPATTQMIHLKKNR